MKETGWNEDEIKHCLAQIWVWLTQGYDSKKVESEIRQWGLKLAEKRKWKEFAGILGKVEAYTRCLKYRGHMPVQLQGSGI